MALCPEELRKFSDLVTPEMFAEASGEERVNLIIRYVANEWGKEYHRCAVLHNGLVPYVRGLGDG